MSTSTTPRRTPAALALGAALLVSWAAAGCNRADTTSPAPQDPGTTAPAPGAGTSPGTVPPATTPGTDPAPTMPPASAASQ